MSDGQQYGTVEVEFRTKEDAKELATETREKEKWLLSPSYLGRVVKKIRIGAIPPAVRANWLMVAALKEIGV